MPEGGEQFGGDVKQSPSQALTAFLDNPEDPYYLPSDSDAPAPPKVLERQNTQQASLTPAAPKQQRATRPPSATLRHNRVGSSAPVAEKKPRKATADQAKSVTENSVGETASATASSRAEQEERKRKKPATCSPAISEVCLLLIPSRATCGLLHLVHVKVHVNKLVIPCTGPGRGTYHFLGACCKVCPALGQARASSSEKANEIWLQKELACHQILPTAAVPPGKGLKAQGIRPNSAAARRGHRRRA